MQKMIAVHLKVDPTFNAPPPDPITLAKCQIVLIRHAVTEFNMEFARVVQAHGIQSDEYRQLKIRKDLIDPQLRPEGVGQCEAAQSHANDINVKIVFVSPMIRTCETAIHIFKGHPNKKNIKFIILPSAKEGLNLCNDKQGTYARLRRIIDPLLKDAELEFDFSLMFSAFGLPDLAQVNVSVDIARFQEMYRYIDHLEELHPEFGYSEHLLKLAYEKFPYRMEDPFKLWERGLQLRKFLNQYLKTHTLTIDEKVVIVSHSAFLTSLSSAGYDHEKKDLIEPEHMHNCQFIPWQTYELNQKEE
ncbi:hypothetical protein FGO68_gene2978 [Halteria grandinella]|uniref:Uncharacterized protein n=1 Tax=Halteria grandinella TaxID=5974 RepID=A0A8J8NSJ0_HALGN|nr:hypothetical protein FGO68_gene2978 [Halteria grandinella]